MYVITYLEDGTITSLGTVTDEFVHEPPPEGVLYMEDVPEKRPFRTNYKVKDGGLIYDPVEKPSTESDSDGQEVASE